MWRYSVRCCRSPGGRWIHRARCRLNVRALTRAYVSPIHVAHYITVRVVGSMCALSPVLRIDVPLKEATEPLRMDALAGVLCHQASFRALGFRIMDVIPARNPNYCQWPKDALPRARAVLKACGQDYPEDALVLGQTYSKQEAVNAIKTLITQVQS